MSIAAMNWAWGIDLAPTPKLILLALADIADDSGVAWPSVKSIARKVNCETRAIQRQLRRLELIGLIICEKRSAANGRQQSNLYRLVLKPSQPCSKPTIPASLEEGGTLTPSPNFPPAEGGIRDIEEGVVASRVRVSRQTPPGVYPATPLYPPDEPLKEPKERTTTRSAVDKALSASEQQEILRALDHLDSAQKDALISQLNTGRKAGTIHSPVAWVAAAVARMVGQPSIRRHGRDSSHRRIAT